MLKNPNKEVMRNEMNDFGKDRVRSLAGLVAGALTLVIIQDYALIRQGSVAYELGASSGAGTATGWWSGILWAVTTGIYFLGSLPIWLRQLKSIGKVDTFDSWRSMVHPATGYILLAFGVWHLVCCTLESQGGASGALASWISAYLQSSTMIPFVYVLGLLALAFHLANGFWRFLVSWGLATGERAIGRATVLASLLFGWVVLTAFESLAVFLQGA